ncbi:5'-nucleotidase C-terminal domain-containing protein [Anoxybacillus sp. J5B_2022]|uniref:5'-nucleotidase C-terminal domain-containing protein n=1 Tax=Anoxybacillus sp. J5B_2022 TaxID=3003246 RepID=UPI00228578C8|nr:5'-nucleotidase C-terminal domain-containing protein [Anoxybacillus sp. J5B_2022]MCZ0756805.1 5'-nucleotidase C-terminal domain-containing protein [Anoxybacillus sp. J5B_2022]
MEEKKTKGLAVCIATMTAVTSSVVVTNPIQAAATSNAEKLVIKAEKLAGALKWEVSYDYRKKVYPKNVLDYPDMKLFNETKYALKVAWEEMKKLKGKEKEILEARLSQNVQVYVDRATSYIDAVSAGKKIEAKANILKKLISNNIVNDSTETAYHDLTKEIRRQSSAFTKVYAASTRNAFVETYVKPAQQVKDAALYPVSIKIETDRLNAALKENKIDQAIYHKNRIEKFVNEGLKFGFLEENSNLLKSVMAYVKPVKAELEKRFTIFNADSTAADKPTTFGGTATGVKKYDQSIILIAGKNQYIKLANAEVNGNIIIKGNETGAGTVYLENVKVNKVNNQGGVIIVDDVADHSLHQKNVTAEELKINDANGANIVAEEGTKIKTLSLTEAAGSTGALILYSKEKGAYEVVSVGTKGSESNKGVELKGDFSNTKVEVMGEGSQIKVSKDAVVKEIEVKTAGKIEAEQGAKVQTVNLAAEKAGQKIELKGDLKEATVIVKNANVKVEVAKDTVVKEVKVDSSVVGSNVQVINNGEIKQIQGINVRNNSSSGTNSTSGTSNTSGTNNGNVSTSPDQTPPTVTLMNNGPVTLGNTVDVRSTETGTVYLVPINETPSTKSALETLVTNGIAKKATVFAINTDIKISTNGLTSGTYRVYAVDSAGNVSNPTGIVTLRNPTDEKTFKLIVMHTNDTHAHLDNIARRITAIKQVRQENPNSLLLDAGDVFSGTLYFSEFNGLADLEFMNLADYDAMTFGNHEFDKGTATLANFVDGAKFPFVSANVDFSKDANLKASFNNEISLNPGNGKIYNGIIKEVNGEKIGIFGLTTAETKNISSPGEHVVFENYIEEAKKAVEAFEAQGVNKIIALTHIGFNDGGGDNDVTLAKEVEGIDIIVGGHSHDKLAKPVVDTTGEEPTVIVQANEYSKYLGKLDVEFDKNGKVVGYDGKLIDIDQKVKVGDKDVYALQDDPEAAQILDTKYKPTVIEKQNTVVGQAAVDLIGGNPPARVGETNLGNFIADGMLAKAKTINPDTVIAFQNGGGIRVTIPAGNITLAKIMEVMPFGNSLAIMKLTGAEIKEALEFSVKDAPKPFGGFLQVSGLRFTYDSRKPVGERVLTVEVKEGDNYVPLDPNKTYVVATNTFTAKGGDGYTMFAKAYKEGRVSEPGFVDWEMFKDYIAAQPNKTVNPSVGGRIVDMATAVMPVNAADFSGTAQSPKVYNGNVSVDVTGVAKLEYATVKGDLYLKGNTAIDLDHVTVEGETYFLD